MLLPAFGPDFARKLAGVSVQVVSDRQGGGSGVIWSADSSGALIVTNAHVVRSNESRVVLPDGRDFAAAILRYDPRRNLAVLRIAVRGLLPAAIGDSDCVRPGQIVAAIGNPFGFIGAVSTGIVHAVRPGRRLARRWIEADVQLAPGNSGGALADTEGCVIGINTMIHAGLALAIPSNIAAAFVRGARSESGAQAA